MVRNKLLRLFYIQAVLVCAYSCKLTHVTEKSTKEKTVFQTASPWKPVTDARSDVAIVYSVKDHGKNSSMTFEERLKRTKKTFQRGLII